MAFLFQKRDIYYISLNYKGKRIRKSLGTSNKRIAKKLANQLEEDFDNDSEIDEQDSNPELLVSEVEDFLRNQT